MKLQILFEGGNIPQNYITMRAYIYDVQPENEHCLGRCSNIFPEVEADRFLFHQIISEQIEAILF